MPAHRGPSTPAATCEGLQLRKRGAPHPPTPLWPALGFPRGRATPVATPETPRARAATLREHGSSRQPPEASATPP
eukprot:11305011-Alexandrium_andersonii.AAC.1